jgi:hypothetical protein
MKVESKLCFAQIAKVDEFRFDSQQRNSPQEWIQKAGLFYFRTEKVSNLGFILLNWT